MRPHPPTRTGTRRGTAAVELALVFPLLLLLLAGVLDVALAIRTAMCAADAARVGAQYGSLSPANSLDTAGMQAAALNAAPGITGMTATAARTCRCPGGSTVNCGGSCTAGGMLVYVQVTVQATGKSVFTYSGLPFSGAVSAKASMRVQ